MRGWLERAAAQWRGLAWSTVAVLLVLLVVRAVMAESSHADPAAGLRRAVTSTGVSNVLAGTVLPIRVRKMLADNATSTLIIGMH